MATGYVHSIEVGSFVDGPGIRFVVFLAGCPLRCQYCHNPDTWQRSCGKPTDSREIAEKIGRSAEFLKAGHGGVTVSGGEPLAQVEFAVEVFEACHEMGLHTALDTSGFLGEKLTDARLPLVDLVLLDIKSYDPKTYRDLTGVDVEPTLRFAERLAAQCRPMWVRFVLVPGVTDDPANVAGLARFVGRLSSVERVEVLPFHQMARHKWDELGLEYKLGTVQPPTPAELSRVKEIFEAEGVEVNRGRFVPCLPTP